jgi:cytoskeletal protein CcmA (bactofilin family)
MISDRDFNQFNYNVLGSGSTIQGDLFLSGDAIVTAEIHGKIEMKGAGKLVLERGSVVRGTVRASDLDVFGTVDGDIQCTGLVSIRSSARVKGSIRSERLVIYPGAIVETDVNTDELL